MSQFILVLGVEIIFGKLKCHSTLVSIDLSNNQNLFMNRYIFFVTYNSWVVIITEHRIGEKGCLAIKEFLKNSEVVLFLKLKKCFLNDACIDLILSGLECNNSIISLNFSENLIKRSFERLCKN